MSLVALVQEVFTQISSVLNPVTDTEASEEQSWGAQFSGGEETGCF